MANFVTLTQSDGSKVFVNTDNMLYVYGGHGYSGAPYTRLVFAGMADGAALHVVETPTKVVELAAGVSR